jgi:hypothetical protein
LATKRELDLLAQMIASQGQRISDLATVKTQELQDVRGQILEAQREYRAGFKEQDDARHDQRNKEFTPALAAMELRWEQRFAGLTGGDRRHT